MHSHPSTGAVLLNVTITTSVTNPIAGWCTMYNLKTYIMRFPVSTRFYFLNFPLLLLLLCNIGFLFLFCSCSSKGIHNSISLNSQISIYQAVVFSHLSFTISTFIYSIPWIYNYQIYMIFLFLILISSALFLSLIYFSSWDSLIRFFGIHNQSSSKCSIIFKFFSNRSFNIFFLI